LPDCDERSVVVSLHGYAEHLGLFGTLARRLIAGSRAVPAMDTVGRGRSNGQRAVTVLATTRHPDSSDEGRTQS
jgi:alpha-beta hydrolase superfamily lysophospholipase